MSTPPPGDDTPGRAIGARYDALFRSCPIGVLVSDVDSRRFRYANPAICAMLGYSGPELLRLRMDDIHPPGALDGLLTAFQQMARGESFIAERVLCLRKDRSVVPADIHACRDRLARQALLVGFFREASPAGRAQETLRQSEATTRAILETVADGIITIEERGRITSFNRAAEALFDYRAEDVLGRNVSLLMPSPDRERHDGYVARYQATGEPRVIGVGRRVFGRRKDGSTFPFHLSVTEVPLPGRRLFAGVVRDLTGSERAEADLRKMTLAVDASVTAIAACDPSGLLTYVNLAALRLWGYDRPEDVLGRQVATFWEEPEKVQRLNETLRRERAWRGELRCRRPDGSLRDVETTVSVFTNERGEPAGLLGTFVDATDRKRTEGELHRSESRYRMLHEHASDAIVILDQKGHLCEANTRAGELFGYGREELLRMKLTDFLLWEDLAARPLRWNELRRGEALSFERRASCKDGRLRLVEGSASLLPDGTVQAILRDVTDKRRAEQALRVTENRLRHVVSNAPVILWAVDRNGIFTLSEGNGLEAQGLKPGEAVGVSIYDLYGDVPDAIRNVERALAGEEFTAIVKGRGLAFETHYFPERDEGGAIVGASGISTDITERVRAEQELRASEERFRQLAENIGVVVWLTTAGGERLLYLSPAFERVWGRPVHELYANPSAWVDTVHPEDRERVLRTFREKPDEHDQTHRIVRPDGSVRWVRVKVSPVRDASGEVVRSVGVAEDITEGRRVQEELIRIQASLADAQRIARLGSWDWDVVTNALWWSDETYRIFGLAPQQFGATYDAFLAHVHPDDRPRVRDAMGAALRERTPYAIDHRVLRPDGSIRVVHERGEVSFDAAGRPRRMIGTVQDVTESREAEEARKTLSSAVEQTADHVFITDREGRILYVNPAFEHHTGFTREEVIGRTPRILKSDVHPPEFHDKLWRVVLAGDVWRGVFVNKKKDGTLYFEEKTIAPIRDPQGQITHFVSTGRDITERRRAEEAQARLQQTVSKSAEEWRATFDAVDLAILIVDPDGRVRRPNRAARDLSGMPFDKIVGAQIEEAGQGPLWEAFARAAREVTRSKEAALFQVKDEVTGRSWNVGASLISTPDLKDGGVIAFARDVTPIVKLQESLRRSETMSAMGRLLAGVAHEVRNPLFGISATLDAFDTDFSDRPEYQQYSKLLRAEVERLTSLMHELLEYGRPATLRFQRGSLNAVLERAARACAARARIASVTIIQEVPEGLPELPMDRGRLAQVFQNLIENAIQHSPAGAAVRVQASVVAGGEAVECRVEDSGPGFREEDLARVFEPFFTRRRGGTGLGLSIVQRIVMEHGGTITAANRPEGGARMTVRLPGSAAPETTLQ